MGRIFISYRREDSADVSGRLYDRLVQRFGREGVFKDVDDIPLGTDFRRVLHEAVNRCEAMLIIIGRQWLTVTDEHGRRRLDNPADFVRIEIEDALEQGVAVIPVLVQDVTVPRADDMPASIAALAFRNALALRDDPYFHDDVSLLISRLAHGDELIQQGNALLAEGRFAEAHPVWEKAVQFAPRSFDAWLNVAPLRVIARDFRGGGGGD